MKLHTWFINIQGEIEMPYFQKPHIGNFELSFLQCEPEGIKPQMNGYSNSISVGLNCRYHPNEYSVLRYSGVIYPGGF